MRLHTIAEAVAAAHGRRSIEDDPGELPLHHAPETHANAAPAASLSGASAAETHAPAANDPMAGIPPADPRIVAQVTPPPVPPAPAAPTASPQQLAMVDLALSDPLNQQLIQAYAPNAVTATGDIARDQAALYGAERFGKMQQLAQATASVRNQYLAALDAAQQAEPPAIIQEGVMGTSAQELVASAPPLPVGWHYDVSVDGEHTATFRAQFDVDAFTAWYAKQDTLASRAFATLYGGSSTTQEAHGGEQIVNRTMVGGEMFQAQQGYWSQIGEHGEKSGWVGSQAVYSGPVAVIDAQGQPDLINSQAVWFDPAMGFVTLRDNIKQKQNFLDKALPSLAAIGITAVTAGAGAFSSIGTAAGGGLAGTMASAAAMSAFTTLNSSLLANCSVHLKDVLKSALTGAVTAGLTQGIGLDKLGMQGNTVVSYADRAIAITGQATLQGALQQLAGGKFKDGFTAGLASGLAAEVTRGMQAGIDAKVKLGQMSGAEASACRLLTQATGSAIRMLSNPNDPGHAMAQDFLGSLVQDGAAAVTQPPAPMTLDQLRQSEHTQANEQAAAHARMAAQEAFRTGEHGAERVPASAVGSGSGPAPSAAPEVQPGSNLAQTNVLAREQVGDDRGSGSAPSPVAPAPAAAPINSAPAPQLPPTVTLQVSAPDTVGTPGSAGEDDGGADIATRRSAREAQQRDTLWSSVGSGGVRIDAMPHSIYVQPGDDLTSIAARWAGAGATADDINNLKNRFIAANPQLQAPNLLSIGQELRFPDDSTVYDAAAQSRANAADADSRAQRAARQQSHWDSLQQGAWSGRTGTVSSAGTGEGTLGPLPDAQLRSGLGLMPGAPASASFSNLSAPMPSLGGDGLPWKIGVGGRQEPNFAYAGPDAPMVPMAAPPGPPSTLGIRMAGLLDAAGGVVQMGAGGAFVIAGGATAEVGVGIPMMVGGALLGLGGADHVQAGWQTFWYAEDHRTVLNSGLQWAGLSPRAAGYLDTGLNGFGTIAAGGWLQGLRNIPAYAPATSGAATGGAVETGVAAAVTDGPLWSNRPLGANDFSFGGTSSSGRPITTAAGEWGAPRPLAAAADGADGPLLSNRPTGTGNLTGNVTLFAQRPIPITVAEQGATRPTVMAAEEPLAGQLPAEAVAGGEALRPPSSEGFPASRGMESEGAPSNRPTRPAEEQVDDAGSGQRANGTDDASVVDDASESVRAAGGVSPSASGLDSTGRGPLSISTTDPVNLASFDRLNVKDPAVNRLRPGEAGAAAELENYMGGTLERAPQGSSVDFVFTSGPNQGKSVDFMLTPDTFAQATKINQFFERNLPNFITTLTDHADAAHFVPVDIRFLSDQNRALLEQAIAQLPLELQSKIILLKSGN